MAAGADSGRVEKWRLADHLRVKEISVPVGIAVRFGQPTLRFPRDIPGRLLLRVSPRKNRCDLRTAQLPVTCTPKWGIADSNLHDGLSLVEVESSTMRCRKRLDDALSVRTQGSAAGPARPGGGRGPGHEVRPAHPVEPPRFPGGTWKSAS